ncbi:retrovirus-related Pol polyprotein from transposon TNT 1-94 [Trichonephila clavipes]|nr:retrovirus-related Pol polyprotein from transposon TNT 1-94 [Trichonephila clavipes]
MEKSFGSDKEFEDDIVSHIAKLQRNFSELKDELRHVAKTTLPDLLLMSRIISTLSSEYFEFKSVWQSVPIEERSVNKLTERLRLIEMRLPSKSTDSIALVATMRIADSGASAHMTKHKNYFVDFTQFNSPKPMYMGNSDAIVAYGHGTLNIEIRINSKWERYGNSEKTSSHAQTPDPDVGKEIEEISCSAEVKEEALAESRVAEICATGPY